MTLTLLEDALKAATDHEYRPGAADRARCAGACIRTVDAGQEITTHHGRESAFQGTRGCGQGKGGMSSPGLGCVDRERGTSCFAKMEVAGGRDEVSGLVEQGIELFRKALQYSRGCRQPGSGNYRSWSSH